jgi:hypothetical protein
MAATAEASQKLNIIESNGFVTRGVRHSTPGFNAADSAGKLTGVDSDARRVVATAILARPGMIQLASLLQPQRRIALPTCLHNPFAGRGPLHPPPSPHIAALLATF